MQTTQTPLPRAIRALPEPLGWYVRPSFLDHRGITDAVAGQSVGLHGVVFDPLHEERQSELRDLVLERNCDAVLDPRTQELAMPGGFKERMAELPWAMDRPHRPDDFADVPARRLVESIARRVVEKGYTAVLAPTHFLASAESPWLDIDVRTTAYLRRELDRAGAADVPIFYSLAVSYEMFRDADERRSIRGRLRNLPIESLWIKISQSGNLTHTAVRNVVNGAADLHALDVPLVGDMVGGLRGLSALGFGAYGGICHGVTQKEVFNVRPWTRADSSSGFTLQPRIYLPRLDMHLKRREAESFFGAHGTKSRFGCHDPRCCPNGWKDMLDNPVRHSLVQRSTEIQRLTDVPQHLRAQRFLEETLRPATDAAVFAESRSFEAERLTSRVRERRKGLERLRVGLGEFVEFGSIASYSGTPRRRPERR